MLRCRRSIVALLSLALLACSTAAQRDDQQDDEASSALLLDGGSDAETSDDPLLVHPALPLGPVDLTFHGFARTWQKGSVRIDCTVTGTNPGPVNASCTAVETSTRRRVQATMPLRGDAAGHRADTRRPNFEWEEGLSVLLMASGDSLYAHMRADSQTENFSVKTGFSTKVQATAVVVQGISKPTMRSDNKGTCSNICRDVGLRCFQATARDFERDSRLGCVERTRGGDRVLDCSGSISEHDLRAENLCYLKRNCSCI